MAGLRFMGRVPFHTVYLHGTARDTQHRRMSKSLGNGIDPLDVVRRYGADALRFTVINGLAVGTDIILDPNDLETSFASGRNFANKLWNVGRLVLTYAEAGDARAVSGDELNRSDLRLADRWIRSRLDRTIREATDHCEKFRLNDAVGAPYHFLWDEFADWYLEEIKPRLRGEEPGGAIARAVAVHCFDTVLRLLHPTMPFITEALWRRLPGRADATIVTAAWPVPEGCEDAGAEQDYAFFQALIASIRDIRADFGVKPGQMVRIAFVDPSPRCERVVRETQAAIRWLGRVTAVMPAPAGAGVRAVLPEGALLFVELGESADLAKQCQRLREQHARLGAQLQGLRAKLANPGFVTKAPANVVQAEHAKERSWSDKLDRLARHLEDLACG